jgi:GNAT superfamily N-acetyltransferase
MTRYQTAADNRVESTALLVRSARPDDKPCLKHLFVQSWLRFWAPHLPDDARQRFLEQDPVDGFLQATLDRLEVAQLGDRIAGAILVDGEWLEDIVVDEDLQGRGIGKHLFLRAVQRGARRLCVRHFNRRAIAFYENMGWTRTRSFMSTEMGAEVLTHEYLAPPDPD